MHDLKIIEMRGGTANRWAEIFQATDDGGKEKKGASEATEVLTTTGTRNVRFDTGMSGASGAATAAVPADEPGGNPKTWTNWQIRQRLERRFNSRMIDGVNNAIRASRPWQAVDMAMDAQPIQRETIPLMLWAMGKIKVKELHRSLTDACGTERANQWFQRNDQNEVIGCNLPKVLQTQIDLVKAYTTRRHAALDALWSNLWPLFRYEPRGTNPVAQLRGDATTQRVDMMCDQFNTRHFLSQCRRDMLMYSDSVAFPRCAWSKQSSLRRPKTNTGVASDGVESYTVREGVDLVNPHPSRRYYDMSGPLANLNTDTGPRFIGYWDIIPYGTILDDPAYFNTNQVNCTQGWLELIRNYSDYFAQYFPTTLSTDFDCFSAQNPADANDRLARVGLYTSAMRDKGMLLGQHFERLNPKQEGICDYDCDVWVRFTIANFSTVVAAEFLPSLPAVYGGINVNDNRAQNQSYAMGLMAYQDALSNILSQMTAQLRSSYTQLWLMDQDVLEKEMVDAIKKDAAGEKWWIEPKLLLCSFSKMREMGVTDPSKSVFVVQADIKATIEQSMKAIGQLLNIVDRITISSPNELGQPNPREVSARETQEISTTVQSVFAFITEGPREQVAACKRLFYESLLSCATESFRVPVVRRYTVETIKAAGFTVEGMAEMDDDDQVPEQTPIMGSLHNLDYDYYFDSRDGAERPVNPQAAQAMTMLLQTLLKVPEVGQAMGLKRIFDMCNTIVRISGVPWDLNLEVQDGQSDQIQPQNQIPPQVMQAIQQLGQQNQQMQEMVQAILAGLQAAGLHLPLPGGGAAAPGQPTPGAPGQPTAGAPAPLHALPPGGPPTGPSGPPASPGPHQVSGQALLAEPQAA